MVLRLLLRRKLFGVGIVGDGTAAVAADGDAGNDGVAVGEKDDFVYSK